MTTEHNKKEKASGAFFIIPKTLLTSPEYADLSAEACLLYGLMLDRMNLSEKNGWKDENDNSFIYFPVTKIADIIRCSIPKSVKIIKELETHNLIRKVKQGQGKPTMYRIIRTSKVLKNFKSKNLNILNSRLKENEIQDFKNFKSNNTDINNTEFSNNLLRGSVEEDVRERIDYDCLILTENRDDVDNIVDIIADTLRAENSKIRIGSDVLPREAVRERLLTLDSEHITYVLGQIYSNRSTIRDVRSYILKLLYYAPSTMSLFYSAKFAENHGLNA